jgi:NADH-quinone oxidoreductase subunit N
MNSFPFSLEALQTSLQAGLPLWVLLITGLALMMLDAFRVRAALPWTAAAGLVLSGLMAALHASGESQVLFFGMLESGGIAPMIHVFLCLSGLITLFFLSDYLKRYGRKIDDVFSLLIFAVLGMILMANAQDLIMTFIGLETMSMCLYIFAALFKTDSGSNEAGLKYFLLGSFASAFLLFGISLIYGLTGSTQFAAIARPESLALLAVQRPIFYVAAGLLLVGLLFKVSAFPFHVWTPDVYQGTPTPLAGFMATGSKMASFVALGSILHQFSLLQEPRVLSLIGLASLLTMVYGNLVAARQQNLKRMLAYSSIAHSGYILLGLCAAEHGFQAVIFYMLIYMLMNMGAFGLLGLAERGQEDTEIESWRGLGLRVPLFAGAMALFLFSLAGIPPLAGFMGKYQVFLSAVREELVLPTVIGVLASLAGAYYYLRVIVVMYTGSESSHTLRPRIAPAPLAGLALLALLVLVLGLFPSLAMRPILNAFAQAQVALLP